MHIFVPLKYAPLSFHALPDINQFPRGLPAVVLSLMVELWKAYQMCTGNPDAYRMDADTYVLAADSWNIDWRGIRWVTEK